jgi:uncharacterized protein with HEPN domain
MERDARSYLWDVRDSSDTILRFVEGKSLQQYIANPMLRAAVERHFEIIGEALNQLKGVDPGTASRIPSAPQAISFRNLLIHGYANINDFIVWRTAREDLPGLREVVANLLIELGEHPDTGSE